MLKIEETNNEHRSDSQRTEALENILLDIRIAAAQPTRGNIENITSHQTMGVVESKIEIGPYSRDLGIIMGRELVMRESRRSI